MVYDLIVIGGSAAATTAGIYAARRGLKFKIISKDFGGEVATSGEIGNWPGINQTDGLTLAEQFKKHLESYKVDMEEGIEVEKIVRNDDGVFCITTRKYGPMMASEKMSALSKEGESKCDYEARAVIVATGVHPRELSVPGEKEFRNKGVSYCTVCDGPLFGGKTVAVIGGGNSALESGLMMADIAKKVYMINKNPAFKGDQVLIDNLKSKQSVEIIYDANVSDIFGSPSSGGFVAGLKYKDGNGQPQELKVDGIFVHIGNVPNSGLVSPEVEKNQFGEIMVNKNCETNIPGLYAAGDVTDVPFKQIIVAAGQGCCAVLSAVNYLNKLR
ncbi:MAG: FAD-dependent oxidoreductase [Candidatus Yanofskybacteria bacterium]|nr:FAD-dependent oxidoreductase [Candidatus Yanofskybacteria bacterium]